MVIDSKPEFFLDSHTLNPTVFWLQEGEKNLQNQPLKEGTNRLHKLGFSFDFYSDFWAKLGHGKGGLSDGFWG